MDQFSKTNPNPVVETRAKRARNKVLTVLSKKSSGSGFVIKRDTRSSILLTSSHVIGRAKPGQVLYVRRMLPGRRVRGEQRRAYLLYQHVMADVAVVRVPGLRKVAPLRFAPGIATGESAIAVGYCNPCDIFPGVEMEYKRIPDLSPGCIMRPMIDKGIRDGVRVRYVRLDAVCMRGMSGSPVISGTGVIGLLDSGEIGYTDAVRNDTILQVLKMYHRKRLQATTRMTAAEITALLDPMNMNQAIDLIP